MSTDLRRIWSAPRDFEADHDAVIVASTDWEPLADPLTRATRWQWDAKRGRVVVDAVRVDVTFAPWTGADTNAVDDHQWKRRSA